MKYAHGWRIVVLCVALLASAAWSLRTFAQEGETAPAPAAQSTDDAMQQLLKERAAPPVIEPQRRPRVEPVPSRTGMPTTGVDIDPAILGVAPGGPQPTLRREGEFVVNRRGRLMRSSDGTHVLFVFDADDKNSPEPPMILQECQYLETMESIVQSRGDQAVFILTGQIQTYRGANYLLPTMMTLASDRGNLQP